MAKVSLTGQVITLTAGETTFTVDVTALFGATADCKMTVKQTVKEDARRSYCLS